jgi:mannosyltransferase OCH1-like enzyme
MRRGVTIFILVTVVVLGFAVHSVWTLLGLLVATGREDAILRGELPAPNSGTINDRPQLIPKIIHQTYINESIPDMWKEPQQTCVDLHPDYEYKVRCRLRGIRQSTDMPQLWTDKKAREFIANEYATPHRLQEHQALTLLRYPWFLETFDGYPYPIQRADAIRYFVLHHFGGIYIDLDDVRTLWKEEIDWH